MWHDDGDEGQSSGELPDPSTRHWRHPSELGQQRALPNPDPTPMSVGSGSTRSWPLVAVGGCIAIAAIGMITLRTDLGRSDSLEAGPGATVVPSPVTFVSGVMSLAVETTTTTSSIEQGQPARTDDSPDGSPSDVPTTGGTTTLLASSANAETSNQRATWGPSPEANAVPEPPAQSEIIEVPVYGVYAAPGRDDGQLGSFTMIGDDPVTSASSIGNRTLVWLRVETKWLAANVVAVDPITDIALLDLRDGADGVTLPILPLADEPVELRAPAMVGYGDPETLDGTSASAADEAAAAPLASTDETIPAEKSDEAKAWASALDRRGLVYSLTKPLTTSSGRLVQEPIRLTTAPGPADAGAPLRNRDGEIVGVVADSTLPQVAAVPIDRVVEVVGWLERTGIGDPAWLGLTVAPSPGGLVVTAIDDRGPSTELAPGDLVIAVDRTLVAHPDGLEFAARQAGPGQLIDLVIDRQGRRQIVQIEVGTATTD